MSEDIERAATLVERAAQIAAYSGISHVEALRALGEALIYTRSAPPTPPRRPWYARLGAYVARVLGGVRL